MEVAEKIEPAGLEGLDGLVAIQLTIRYWPGQIKLRAEDLGLKEDEVPEIFSLGRKRLYPMAWYKAFAKLEGQARNWLSDHSYPYFIDSVRTVPKRNLAKTIAQLEAFREELITLVDEFLGLYDCFRDQWQERYPHLWPRLASHYPTPAYLKTRFGIDWQIFELRGATYNQAEAPEVIEAYEKARAELEVKVEEMIQGNILLLRKRVMEKAQDLAARIREGRIVRNDTLQSVRNLHEWYQDLNVFGKMGLDEHLGALRATLDGVDYAGLKDNEGLKAQIASLADAVVNSAADLEDISMVTGNYRRMIDLG